MDYLVTMTTQVPDGTPEQAVDDVRAREAAHSAELAARGHLLRLWRPPLKPGEWRTLGLFAAGNDDQLEEVLASMPLRIWRQDEVTPLAPHPNDPALAGHRVQPQGDMQFLVDMTINVPAGTPDSTASETRKREAECAAELAGEGYLLRLWTPPAQPGESRALGLYSADTPADLQAILESLPQYAWMTIETTPLSPHPSDPALGQG
jgi:muconolactone delta-isomerase